MAFFSSNIMNILECSEGYKEKINGEEKTEDAVCYMGTNLKHKKTEDL